MIYFYRLFTRKSVDIDVRLFVGSLDRWLVGYSHSPSTEWKILAQNGIDVYQLTY